MAMTELQKLMPVGPRELSTALRFWLAHNARAMAPLVLWNVTPHNRTAAICGIHYQAGAALRQMVSVSAAQEWKAANAEIRKLATEERGVLAVRDFNRGSVEVQENFIQLALEHRIKARGRGNASRLPQDWQTVILVEEEYPLQRSAPQPSQITPGPLANIHLTQRMIHLQLR